MIIYVHTYLEYQLHCNQSCPALIHFQTLFIPDHLNQYLLPLSWTSLQFHWNQSCPDPIEFVPWLDPSCISCSSDLTSIIDKPKGAVFQLTVLKSVFYIWWSWANWMADPSVDSILSPPHVSSCSCTTSSAYYFVAWSQSMNPCNNLLTLVQLHVQTLLILDNAYQYLFLDQIVPTSTSKSMIIYVHTYLISTPLQPIMSRS